MLDRKKFESDLENLVNMDSGSYDVDGLLQVAQWLVRRYEALGWETTWFDPAPGLRGKSFFVAPAATDEIDLLIICHIDTVFPQGEAAKRPFSKGENRIFGPGAADMKAGCLFSLYAIEQLLAEKAAIGRIGVFYNAQEEISSVETRPIIEEYIQKSRIVITAEPAKPDGAYVKQRKGVLRYKVLFEGISAHAGNNPEDGACAVTEMANWILFAKTLEDVAHGVTVNPGLAKGGTGANTVADQAELQIDIRTRTQEASVMVDKAMRAYSGVNPKVKVTLEGGITRPPMVPNAQTEELCAIAEKIGAGLGLEIKWVFAGGGSDASFASALGKPALCGLGPVSGKLHTKDEYINTTDLDARYEEFKEIIKQFSTYEFISK